MIIRHRLQRLNGRRKKFMKNALKKDIIRTIWKEKKRFISIMMITMLGVTVMTGLAAGCRDLRMSADRFFDEQKLYDISIQSTLGLTEEDVEVLCRMEGVKKAEGSFSEIVHTKKGDSNKTAEVKMIKEEGLNLPYLAEGTLPVAQSEIAVTKNYIEETGKKIGDHLTIEELTEEEEDIINFPNTTFTITGVVIDVMDINNAEGSAGFRATPNADYTFFVTPDAVDSEVYTVVYLALEGTDELLCYSQDYEKQVASVLARIENEIMEQREKARHEEVTQEAYAEVADAEKEMEEAFDEAQQEIDDARQEIADSHASLEDGKRTLIEKEAEAAQKIADARKEIEDGYLQIEDAQEELAKAQAEIEAGAQKLQEGMLELIAQEESATKQLEDAQTQLDAQFADNHAQKQQLDQQLNRAKEPLSDAWSLELQTAWENLIRAARNVLLPLVKQQAAGQTQGSSNQGFSEEQMAQIMALLNQNTEYTTAQGEFALLLAGAATNAGITDTDTLNALQSSFVQLAIGLAQNSAVETMLKEGQETLLTKKAEAKAQFEKAWDDLESGSADIAQARAQLADAKKELEENRKKLDDAVLEIDANEKTAQSEIADAREELLEGERELLEGEEELAENERTFAEEKEEAREEIREAKQEIADIDMTKWYVQDRTSLSGYSNVETDASCIESLASVFAVVFFVVAILISLTTVTRMVEEERGLIGTYKALGFTDREIRKKYVSYALLASLFGGVLGDLGGFVILPEVLFIFFDVMYMLPHYYIQAQMVSGTVSVLLFVIGIAGAAYVACFAELKHLPAYLMRPKSPKMGSRVFLEYITPLWKRLSFLNKVTARNLFRYKKRFFMTVLGIMGCTALLVFGFAIKDSVSELMPMQYEGVYQYDLLAAVAAEDNEKLISYMEHDQDVEQYLNMQVETIKLINAQGENEKVQMIIFPDEALDNAADNTYESYLTLTDREFAPCILEEEGIYVTENAALILGLKEDGNVKVQKLDLSQEETKVAGIVKNYLGNNVYMTQTAYEALFGVYEPNGILANLKDSCQDQIAFADTLSKEDWILSAVSTEELKEGFSAAFTLINIVVYVVLLFAAGLAFVVLFTLANVNISERVRELATIKVLGFYDKEVHSYVNKETLILTGIGILLGLPVGAAMSHSLTSILNMPSIYFAVTIYKKSYLFAAGLAFLFALLVQCMTDRTLNVIEPAEALKSVE